MLSSESHVQSSQLIPLNFASLSKVCLLYQTWGVVDCSLPVSRIRYNGCLKLLCGSNLEIWLPFNLYFGLFEMLHPAAPEVGH
jgi:hypothetical protein